MSQFILGILEDNTTGFILDNILNKGYLTNFLGYPYTQNINPILTNEPLLWNLYFLLNNFLDSVLVYNILAITSLIVLLIFGYKFFRYFFTSKAISIALSTILTFSPYMYYQLQSHLNLSQVWLLVLFLSFFIKAKKTSDYLYSGIVLGVLLLFSTYLGYFALLFLGIYTILKIALIAQLNIFRTALNSIIILTVAGVFAMVGLSPLISTALNNSSGSAAIEDTNITAAKSRTYEEFFYFTSRPWYYFLPSIENPFFGKLSESTINFLQKDWGYWLTTNHFPREHTASYLGYINFLFAIIGLAYIINELKNKKILVANGKLMNLRRITEKELNTDNKLNIYGNLQILFFTGLILIILSMPPYITLNLNKIYLPSHLLFSVLPMFRVLARLGIVILLIQLIFTGFGYKTFLLKLEGTKLKSIRYFILGLIVAISLMEFYVPIRFTDVSAAPGVFTYIRQNTQEGSPLVIYPHSKTNDAVYWVREHNRPIINPFGLKRTIDKFDSAIFTEELTTCEGLVKAKELGAEYLIYFNRADDASYNADQFFDNSSLLEYKAKFEEYGTEKYGNDFIVVNNKVDSISFSARIYELNFDLTPAPPECESINLN